MKKILYLSDRPLGEQCLNALLQARADIAGVVSRSSEEECWWGYCNLPDMARQHNLYWFDHSKPLAEIIAETNPDLLISVLFTRLVSPEILEKVPGVNLHCAPLPEYKGFNSSFWAIFNRAENFGSTLHQMTPEADGGAIIESGAFKIPANCTNFELYHLAQENAFSIFCRNLDRLLNGDFRGVDQNGEGRYYKKGEFPGREVDLSWSREKIALYARAFYFPPFEPAYFNQGGRKINLLPV